MPHLDEPDWPAENDAQRVEDDPSAVCNQRFSPSIVTGLLLRALQAHFSDGDNIRDPKLKGLIWTESSPAGDAIDSEIDIAPMHIRDSRRPEQRPAIYVRREKLAVRKLPLQSKVPTSLDGKGLFSGEKYVVPVVGTHLIRCVAKSAFAADRLGEEVFYFLLEYCPALLADFPFSDLDITGLNAPVKVVEDSSECFAVDVVLNWTHLHGWTMKTVAPILKKVKASASPA